MDAPVPHKDDNLSVNDLGRMKIAIPHEFFDADLSEDCKRLWNEAIVLLKMQGATVEPISMPEMKHITECYHILNESDIFSNMAR